MRFESPTHWYEVRVDKWGHGGFGASRGSKAHDGLDLVVVPGGQIFSPIDGVVEKIDYPYRSDLSYTGIQIANGNVRVEIWYMEPDLTLIGKYVHMGDHIGIAQDISLKYPPREDKGAMIPHIHLRVTNLPMAYLINGKWAQYEITLNPEIFIGGI
jgi:hypothetical protein